MLVSNALRSALPSSYSAGTVRLVNAIFPKVVTGAPQLPSYARGEWTSSYCGKRVERFSVMPSSAMKMSDKEVNDLFQLWNRALKSLDPETVAKRYAKDSILLPTVSNIPRMDYESIKSYFVDFLKKKPQGRLLQSKVIKGDDWALDAGIYEFTMGATGDKVKARYTYLYKFEDGEWKISHHHSSVMPES